MFIFYLNIIILHSSIRILNITLYKNPKNSNSFDRKFELLKYGKETILLVLIIYK